MIAQWFDSFLQEKIYINNLSPHTIRSYKRAFKTFCKFGGELSKDGITQFIVACRKAGMKMVTVNTYSRGLNSFFTWLHENSHTPERLRVKIAKKEKKVMPTFSDDELKRIITFKPERYSESRIKALLCTLMDTGLRIDEALGLKRTDIDFGNLLMKVHGKGNKERVVPFSFELRKMLFLFLKLHDYDYVFPSRRGTKWYYEDAFYASKLLCRRLRISPLGFHSFRRTFAVQYVRYGGNVFGLQRILGHENLATTRIYVELDTDYLQEMHTKTSALSRLSGRR